MRSFGILRTNPGLTTNLKIMVDSSYGLSLESINSNTELSASKFKKFDFTKENLIDELIPQFYEGLPADIAYEIKYDDDNKTMTNRFADQYDEIYQYGARNITDNKNYVEEYEYFAPLYVYKNKLPSHFIIFRVDGPGIINLNKDNFKSEIISKLKTVSVFDLSRSTGLGYWLDLNINSNTFFPNTSFDMNFDTIEFSVWKGINFRSGGYVDKSLFLDHVLERENEIFELEKFILDGYRRNEVVFPNIMNLSFLFDDTPADEYRLKKWSINRYFGFYIDALERIKTISPYNPPALRPDVEVMENNILSSSFGDPFTDGWSTNSIFYVECQNEYYRVEKFTEKLDKSVTAVNANSKNGTQGTLTDLNDITNNTYKKDEDTVQYVDRWRIISDVSLKGKGSLLNANTGTINLNKEIVMGDGSFLEIEDFDRCDVWLIEIDGKYHNLGRNSSGNIYVNSDYSFFFSDRTYRYLINRNDKNFTKVVSTLVDENNKPKKFNIYRVRFSDVKDFDTRIVETESSKFEYDLPFDVADTPETKQYFTNLNTTTLPRNIDDFYYKDKYVNIPVSSEYTTTQEIFKVNAGDLSPIWRKNPVHCRWGFEGSLSSGDYPYTLNNSFSMEPFNRTSDTFDTSLDPISRSLEYFYTINSSSAAYSHHSLHIQRNRNNAPDPFFDFDFDSYFNVRQIIGNDGLTQSVKYDYFNHIFTLRTEMSNGAYAKNTKKYSEFIKGDNDTPNTTLFRGIKFTIHDVENIKTSSNGAIDTINLVNKNTFEDYKFSVILTQKDNGMEWIPIDRWDVNKQYREGDLVLSDDILYRAVRDTIYKDPVVYIRRTPQASANVTTDNSSTVAVPPAPHYLLNGNTIDPSETSTGKDWELARRNFPFWNPMDALLPSKGYADSYNLSSRIFRDGIYYQCTGSDKPIDFWNPLTATLGSLKGNQLYKYGYSLGNIVYYKEAFYESVAYGNVDMPTSNKWKKLSVEEGNKLMGDFRWAPVEAWLPNKQYTQGTPVTHLGTLYESNGIDPLNREPNKAPERWKRIYSMVPDTDFVYTNESNPYISQNGSVYMLVNNVNRQTLDNGVRVIINHLYKNVLVNIYFNDNTLPNLRDTDRHKMYNNIYQKLCAKNFIDYINHMSNKFGFSDYLKYVVVDNDGKITEHSFSNNLHSLKHVLLAEGPEEIMVNINSLQYSAVNEARLKPDKVLKESRITEFSEINHYNTTNFGVEIFKSPETLEFIGGYKKIKRSIFRFSGGYVPLFYDIELFNTDNSIEFKTIDVMFEISDAMEVIFLFSKDGQKTEQRYTLQPGSFFGNAREYYGQVVDSVKKEYPGIEFNFDILNKPKGPIGNEVFLLDSTSYNASLQEWFDVSRNKVQPGGYAKIVNAGKAPTMTKTDLYPGTHFRFYGTTNQRSFMETTEIRQTGYYRTYEFLVKGDNVFSYCSFMGNGDIIFGFEDGRAFMKSIFETSTTSAVYSEKILQNNTWYHVVFTVNAETTSNGTQVSTMKVYIDGGEWTTNESVSLKYPSAFSTSSFVVQTESFFAIGAGNKQNNNVGPYPEYFSGAIADVRFYNRCLGPDEIYQRFVDSHSLLSIKYKATEGDITLKLIQNVPRLTLDIYDQFDPLYPFYVLKLGATGGNPPYVYSYNGAAYSSVDEFINIPKPTSHHVVVKDVIGLTSSFGYYTINSVIEYKTDVDGPFTY